MEQSQRQQRQQPVQKELHHLPLRLSPAHEWCSRLEKRGHDTGNVIRAYPERQEGRGRVAGKVGQSGESVQQGHQEEELGIARLEGEREETMVGRGCWPQGEARTLEEAKEGTLGAQR